MSKFSLIVPALAALLTLASGRQDPTDDVGPAATPELAELAWITGSWVREKGTGEKPGQGEVLHEQWGAPIGNAMTGAFRWYREGVGFVYEFLLIEKTDKGVTFYLRHFGPGSRAFEPVDEPLAFPLLSASPDKVVFEHPTREELKRMIYERDGDRLTVRVQGERPDGTPTESAFEFVRRG